MLSNNNSLKSNSKANVIPFVKDSNHPICFQYVNKPLKNDQYEVMNPQRLKLIKRKPMYKIQSELNSRILLEEKYFKHQMVKSSLAKLGLDNQSGQNFKGSFEKNILFNSIEKKHKEQDSIKAVSAIKVKSVRRERNAYCSNLTVQNKEVSSEKGSIDYYNGYNQLRRNKKVNVICIDTYSCQTTQGKKKKKSLSTEMIEKKEMIDMKRHITLIDKENESFYDEVKELLNNDNDNPHKRKEKRKIAINEDCNYNTINRGQINLINEARPITSYGRISLRKFRNQAKPVLTKELHE